uniref:Tissue factor pathway inhibitor n=1 Tax=Rhipicephalus zambeziensis TaxID=60191 RepID=A0A224YPR0_9ACAR
MFLYSGCGGNDNRFSSESSCQWNCLPRRKMKKAVCSRKEYGEKCNGRTEKWYFDHYSQRCREFKEGYCGLVPNRFNSCYECITRCSDISPKVACITLNHGAKTP